MGMPAGSSRMQYYRNQYHDVAYYSPHWLRLGKIDKKDATSSNRLGANNSQQINYRYSHPWLYPQLGTGAEKPYQVIADNQPDNPALAYYGYLVYIILIHLIQNA